MLTEEQIRAIEEDVQEAVKPEYASPDEWVIAITASHDRLKGLLQRVPALIRDLRILRRALDNAATHAYEMAHDIAMPFNEADTIEYLQQAEAELKKEEVIPNE